MLEICLILIFLNMITLVNITQEIKNILKENKNNGIMDKKSR